MTFCFSREQKLLWTNHQTVLRLLFFIVFCWTMFVGLPQLIFNAGSETQLADYNTKWYYPKYSGLSSSIIKIPFSTKQNLPWQLVVAINILIASYWWGADVQPIDFPWRNCVCRAMFLILKTLVGNCKWPSRFLRSAGVSDAPDGS